MSEDEITAPVDVDPDQSPFPVPAIEGLPFPRDSAEARAIRLILDPKAGKREGSDDREPDPDESPFELPAIEGLPFPRHGAEARAIRRILGEAAGDSAGDG